MPLKHLVLGLAIVATIPTAFTTAEAADGLLRSIAHLSHRSIRGLGNTLR